MSYIRDLTVHFFTHTKQYASRSQAHGLYDGLHIIWLLHQKIVTGWVNCTPTSVTLICNIFVTSVLSGSHLLPHTELINLLFVSWHCHPCLTFGYMAWYNEKRKCQGQNLRHSFQLIYLFFVLWQAIYSWDMAISLALTHRLDMLHTPT